MIRFICGRIRATCVSLINPLQPLTRMKEYLFVLGRDKELALLELESKFSADCIKCIKGNFAVVETDGKIAIDEFGGITKIGKLVKDYNEIVFDKDKITYSFFGGKREFLLLKDRLKEEKVKASFRRFDYSPGNVDLELIQFDNKLFLIEQASNPREYKLRDENRPRFDAKKVISIRLARMMINFSKAEKCILDPFCVNGTILQEGLLMGKDVIGMDRNIKEARENLNWLKRNFNFNGEFKLIEGDANRLTEYFDRVECVVTEPYMGPYFKKLPSVGKGKRVMRSLMQLYQGLFRELGKIVDGRVVIILPAIRTYKKVIGGGFFYIA